MDDDLKPDEQSVNSEELLELPDLVASDQIAADDSLFLEDEPQISAPVVVEPIEETAVTASHTLPENRPRKVYTGMWGQSEIAAVGLGLMAILAVVLFVVIFLLPAKNELEKNRAERDALEEELKSSRNKYGSITDTETEVASLLASVDDFESRYLRIPANGQTAVYQQLNGLIGAYGLVNTAGPDYAPLDILDMQKRQQQPEGESGRDKLISLFPGLYVTVTVEGNYRNLRRFVRDIETSGQFIMISSIEFVPADAGGGGTKVQTEGDKPMPEARTATADTGKTHGETVSLKLEMAAYFSRSRTAPLIDEATQQ